MTGKTFGKYRIVGQLGRGGMGIVYRAVDEVLGREVAVKILNAQPADGPMADRFRHEAILLARLNHPRIATIHELFRSETALLMVMELVRGETLESILQRAGPLPPDLAAFVMDQVLAALEHAHRAGIVHRDLKPANVMVAGQGDLKVMDFGVARVRAPEHGDGCLVGTPAYMAPEQVLGEQVDARADLYSAGVVFYRLLCGALPLTADSSLHMLQAQLSDAPAPLRDHRSGLPDWCQAVVDRALAKSPADRFQSAASFRETLAEAGGVTVTLGAALAVRVAAGTAPVAADADGLEPVNAAGAAEPPFVPEVEEPERERTLVLQATGHWSRPALASVVAAAFIFAAWGLGSARPIALRPAPAPAPPAPAAAPAPQLVVAAHRAEEPPLPTPDVAPPRSSPPRLAPRPVQSAPVSPGPPAVAPAISESSPALALPPAAPPERIAFRAKTLVADGDRWRERDCQVMVAGKMSVRAVDDRALLHTISYDHVLSVSYSRGRHPLWVGPAGPTAIARTGGGAFGLFRGDRHWLALRTSRSRQPFVVLRVDDETLLLKAVTAIEARTGRTVQVVGEAGD